MDPPSTPLACFARVIACSFLALALPSNPASSRELPPALGREVPELAPLDRMMVTLIREQDVPGAALAVARDGRLLYARGFGLADRREGTSPRPDSLFRIASVSKPITAVTILRLVEQAKLAIDTRVFDFLNLAERLPPGSTLDPRWKEITVLDLLQHRGGWDGERSFDPMFRSVEWAREAGLEPPADPWTIIQCMLERPLDFEPGRRTAYSNFGYCLLGRVIEAATGLSYEEAVRREVFSPLGLNRPKLGRTLPAHRATGEVHYYPSPLEATGPSVFPHNLGQPVPQPYGAWCLEAMDAHGGWIASAVDLVRFGSALPEILSEASLENLFARPSSRPGSPPEHAPGQPYQACGWLVRPVGAHARNTWHTGSLPGTESLLVRRHDGFVWAVLFNTRAGRTVPLLASHIDPLVHQAVDNVTRWPATDLFPEFLPRPELDSRPGRCSDAGFP